MTTEITTKQNNLPSTRVAPRGFENVEAQDLITPRLQLVHGTSVNSIAKSRDGFHVGTFVNSLTQQEIPQPFEFVPIFMRNSAAYFDEENKLVCKSEDSITNREGVACRDCPFGVYHGEWKDGKPPRCQAAKEFLAVPKDQIGEPFPAAIILSFKRTSYDTGRQLITMARMLNKDMFARTYKMTSKTVVKPKGDTQVYDLKPGVMLNEEEFANAERLYEFFNSQRVVTHEESVSDDGSKPY